MECRRNSRRLPDHSPRREPEMSSVTIRTPTSTSMENLPDMVIATIPLTGLTLLVEE
jgi:hypothetical protein